MKRDVPAPQATVTSLLPADRWPLGHVKEWLEQGLNQGVHCPCCGQFAKLYRRKLYGTQARTLIYAHRHFRDEYFHLSLLDGRRSGVRQADFPKLAYWELIERHPARPVWQITDRGRQWLHRVIKLPETAVLYDARLRGFEGRMVSIVDVLPKQFDYEELMR